MSDTISVDVVGPSYWSYMAYVMADCLDEFVHKQEVNPEEIPLSVYDGAKEFFDLVLQVGVKFPRNPTASINTYMIAADALRGSMKTFPKTSDDLRSKLVQYQELVKGLETRHSLMEEESEIAKSLRDFFLQLAQDGEIESYERSFHHDLPSPGYYLT